MDMTLSKRGDYVMRSAICLARAFDAGTSRKIREVVAETEVPQTFASQILADLGRAGLAIAKAGRGGGYRLTRPPGEITVLEVIEAAEGPLRAERCALGDGPCRWEAVCPLHETWSMATAALRELLAKTTLAELAARDAAIEAGTYPVPSDAHRSHPVATPVADVVHVELAADALHVALARISGKLAAIVEAAALDLAANASRPKSGHHGATVVEASVAPVAGRNPSETGSGSYLLLWELTLFGVSSRLEAEMTVMPVDAERSEVGVQGTWRRNTDGPSPSADDLEDQARRMVRAFLRHLARSLEEGPTETRVSRGRGTSRSSKTAASRSA